jgi:porphobilinogen deaminase
VENGKLVLEVAVLSPDGAQRMREKSWGAPEEAVSLGERVAAKMLAQGAAAMLAREGRGTRA